MMSSCKWPITSLRWFPSSVSLTLYWEIVVTELSCFFAVTTISQPIKRQAFSVCRIKWKNLGTNNQGLSTWATLFWYLSFSLPMLFCNGFSMICPSSRSTLKADGEKEVEHNMSTLCLRVLQLTQVLMTRIVASFVIIKRSRTLIKVELGTIYGTIPKGSQSRSDLYSI